MSDTQAPTAHPQPDVGSGSVPWRNAQGEARPGDLKIDLTMRVAMWRCAEIRTQAGLSQTDMAERIGRLNPRASVTAGGLSRFERGERWLDSARTALRAYARIGGLISAAWIWQEAATQTIAVGDDWPPFLETAAVSVPDAIDRLEQLRELHREQEGGVP